MKITCPGKTFLIGEYAVLNGGPAILLSTPPYFSLEENIFSDPYQGIGGFGASGAKFVLSAYQENKNNTALKVWEKYQAAGLSGSGADVVSQWTGGLCFFYPKEKKIEPLYWPFQDYLIILIHTGVKILTHQHLANLADMPEDLNHLNHIILDAYYHFKNFKNNNINLLINNIKNYAQCLKDLGLVCENTQKLLSRLYAHPDVLAAKGCGAMGADVILAVIPASARINFLHFAQKENFNIIYIGNKFARGVSLDVN